MTVIISCLTSTDVGLEMPYLNDFLEVKRCVIASFVSVISQGCVCLFFLKI